MTESLHDSDHAESTAPKINVVFCGEPRCTELGKLRQKDSLSILEATFPDLQGIAAKYRKQCEQAAQIDVSFDIQTGTAIYSTPKPHPTVKLKSSFSPLGNVTVSIVPCLRAIGDRNEALATIRKNDPYLCGLMGFIKVDKNIFPIDPINFTPEGIRKAVTEAVAQCQQSTS